MFNFDKKTELIVQNIAAFGAKIGAPVYFVGGMVRDCLMKIDIKDIDILIEGSAIDFVEKFALEYGGATFGGHCGESSGSGKLDIKIKSVHESFNTAKTVINGKEIDFASTRKEEYPLSGCLPVVTKTGCPIKDDLKRRDFTVNAIAARLSLSNEVLHYEIIDPYFGAKDIKKKCLTVLHDKSYIDDPTRILRGLDFSLRFGFDFAENDKRLIEEYLKNPDREGLSIDRVKLTLKKLFSTTDRAKDAYLKILENGYYKIWQDEAGFKKEWAQRLFRAIEIFNVKPEEVFFGAVFEGNKQTESHTNGELPQNASNFEIYNFYKNFKPLDLALRYAVLDDSSTIHFYKKLKNIKLDITGNDLIKQGFTQGKAIGCELTRLLKEKLNSVKGNNP